MADLFYDPCEDEIVSPTCDPCGFDRELGGVRSAAFFHKSLYADLKANPEDVNLWAQGIEDKKIFIIPETLGSFDGGSPVEVTGYGDIITKIIGYNFSVAYKDPTYKANCAFYNSIKGSSNWHFAFRTEKLTRISDKAVAILPKSPVAEDRMSEVVWDVEVKWSERDQPCPFDTPEGIFTCTPVEPVPVVPFTFKFGTGEAPTDETGINGGTSGSANHNAKATVPDFGNTEDEILWYAEPVSEPVKTKWYNTITNHGSIGATDLFLSPVTIGEFRIYVSAYATTFSAPAAVEFRIT